MGPRESIVALDSREPARFVLSAQLAERETIAEFSDGSDGSGV